MHALPETLTALRQHIFNGVIWPDFTRLPSAEHPVLEFLPFGDRTVGSDTIRPVPPVERLIRIDDARDRTAGPDGIESVGRRPAQRQQNGERHAGPAVHTHVTVHQYEGVGFAQR